MSILVDQNTRLLVQGITGKEGSYHAARCREYGTNLVAGVTPGKGGQLFDGDVPVYDTVERAVDETGANASLIFVLGIGQSTSVGIGGDPVNGTSFVDVLELFNDDPETDCVIFIGEIGGTKEQEAAEYIGSSEFNKAVAALIVGRSAPPGRRMGHAGAIITGKAARADEKIKALERAGAAIIPSPADIGVTVQQMLP